MVEEGKFREDLYYRLNVISLEMPALRARPSDSRSGVALSAQVRRREREGASRLHSEALEHMAAYNWPGNVRELENVVERAVVLAQSAEVTLGGPAAAVARPAKPREGLQIPGATMDEIERYAITKTLESTGGSTSRRRRDPEHQRAEDPVQAPRVRERAQVGAALRSGRRRS